MLVNVDAAISSHSRRIGYGVVVRDHLGTLLAAYQCSYIDHIQNPEVAKALAVGQALVFVEDAVFIRFRWPPIACRR